MDALASGGYGTTTNATGYFPGPQSASADTLTRMQYRWSNQSSDTKEQKPGELSDLVERIEKALSRNPYVPKRRLRIETHDGRVVIRGVVHSYFQKQMVQETLRKVEGIEEICNELEVASR